LPHLALQFALIVIMGTYTLSRRYNVEVWAREPENERERVLVRRLVILKRTGVFAALSSVVWIFVAPPQGILEVVAPFLLFIGAALLQLVSTILYRPFLILH
jgi:hypothetical protein